MPPPPHPVVLVVDDDPSLQQLLERLLLLHAYTPLRAASVAEAMAATLLKKVDAIVLDLGLTCGDDGLDMLRWLRQQPGYVDVPVMVLTGRPLAPDDEDALRYYRADVRSKPQPIHELVSFLRTSVVA